MDHRWLIGGSSVDAAVGSRRKRSRFYGRSGGGLGSSRRFAASSQHAAANGGAWQTRRVHETLHCSRPPVGFVGGRSRCQHAVGMGWMRQDATERERTRQKLAPANGAVCATIKPWNFRCPEQATHPNWYRRRGAQCLTRSLPRRLRSGWPRRGLCLAQAIA